MRLFWMTVPEPLESAVGACRSHFALAAGLSALVNILHLAPTMRTLRLPAGYEPLTQSPWHAGRKN